MSARRDGAADPALDALRARWQAAWPEALAAWGRFVRLRPPRLHGPGEAPAEVRSFAWFSTTEVVVGIDLADVARRGLADHAVAVLAHEVGHHVLSPGDLGTSARLVARARVGLVDRDGDAGMIANLWSDLLVNDRLQRRAGVRMDLVWRALGPPTDPLFRVVLRADELLWQLAPGTLTGRPPDDREADAQLVAQLVRVHAGDPVAGVGGFAALCRPLLAGIGPGAASIVCGQHEVAGAALPSGLAGDPALTAPVLHPALDPAINDDLDPDQDPDDDAAAADDARASGQGFGPADLAAVRRALGLGDDDATAAAAWYRDRAGPLLIRFPVRTTAARTEPQLEGLDPWEVGDDLADVDWTATLTRSPVVVPGVTTVRRVFDAEPGRDVEHAPLDLDLYVDSSGSMPDPRRTASPLALAGAVLALSALRAGALTQVTTWSGARQVVGTDGFTDDPDAVLRALVAFFGGGTSFPLPLLARTHLERPRERACHVAVISDSGIFSLLGQGQPAELAGVATRAVAAAGGGGTLVLDVPASQVAGIVELAPGYDVHAVQDQADMVAFAATFARRTWTRSR